MARERTASDHVDALVLEVSARHAVVLAAGERVRCSYRKELFRAAGRASRPASVGDVVRISNPPGGEPILEEVLPRTNWISRGRRGSDHEQIIVANVARVFVVGSAGEPDFRPRLVDRLLTTAERASAPAFVIINKVDLARDRPELEDWAALYRGLGYDAALVSVRTGEGVDAVRDALGAGITLVAGQSGVGKSTLVSAVAPGLALLTAPVSDASGKGQHTTTRVSLYATGREGGYIADSPGVRSFALAEPPGPDLGLRFREFVPFIDACRFRDCLHLDEPGCAVRAALERGVIDARRYASYERIARGDESDVPRD